MKAIEFLRSELVKSNNFFNMLISEVPEEDFFKKSEASNANIAWQVGHLCIANYAHYVSFCGQIENHPPLREFSLLQTKCKGLGDTNRYLSNTSFKKEELLELHKKVFSISSSVLNNLTNNQLSQPILDKPFKHPHANNIGELIGYALRHEMWHCAEIEALKREFSVNHVFI